MMWVAVFALFFVAGPLLFRTLTQAAPSKGALRALGLFTALCAVGGLGLRYGLPMRWGKDIWVTGAGILLIWFAWVGVLAFAAQALRRAEPGRRMQRITGVIGALGTTVPWFGLASANLVGF